MKDLILLVADKSMQFALQGALDRSVSLGIRPVTVDFRQHPGRDGGARTSGVRLLALEKRRFAHALLVLDHEGSGTRESPQELENKLDADLARDWGKKAKAIVIEPELETWMWGSDAVLSQAVGWSRPESIREWPGTQGYTIHANGKPERPKEALEAVFRLSRLPRSAANYQRLAQKISLHRCQDQSFQQLRTQLRIWFAAESE